jgi:hypothetical protein
MVNEEKIQKGIAESIDIKVEHKDIVEGEVQKEMNDQITANPHLPWLPQLLESFKEVFSALPPPGTVPKIVTMDLKLKEEFKDQGLRSKCFPMPKADSNEIEAQVNELIKANLVEEYTGTNFPRFCSPTFLVDKEKGKDQKTTKSKRMVGDYRKLYQRTMTHAGYLPSLEANIESLANTK